MKQLLIITIIYFVFGFNAYSQTRCDYNTKALKEMAKHKLRRAIANFNLALQCTGNKDTLAEIYLNRSQAEFALNEYKKAIADDSIYLTYNRDNGKAYQAIANCYEELKNYNAAVNDIKLAIPYYTNDTISLSQLYDKLGDDLCNLNNFNDAINAYDRSYSLYHDASSLFSVINCYIELGNDEAAIKTCDTGILHCSNDTFYHSNDVISRYANDSAILATFYDLLGNCLPFVGKIGKAFEAYNHALALNPKGGGAYLDRAIAYEDTLDYQNAINDLSSPKLFSEFVTNESSIYEEKATDERLLGRYKDAVKDLLKAIHFKPKGDTTLYTPSYGVLYLELGMAYRLMNKKTKAQGAFKKSIQLDTSDITPLDLYFLGDSAAAVKNITDKIHTDSHGRLPQDYYIAACLMAVMNKPNETIEYLKESIKNGAIKSTIMYDPYFISIRYNPAFVELMKQ